MVSLWLAKLSYTSYVSHCCDKCPPKQPKDRFEGTIDRGDGGWSHCGHSPEAERDGCWYSVNHVFPFIQLEAHEMASPSVRLGPPTSTQSRTPF